jgi:peptidoglycan hydrolase-like protein with peptidoglycan-binding domain/DNA invertase Pin-like site-specific DNA recombinase
MRRTYRVPFSRAGLAGLLAALVLLCLPGASIAGGASDSSSALASGPAVLQYGDGYGQASGAAAVRDVQRALRRLGWQPGPVDGLYGPRTQAAVIRYQTAAGLAADGVVGAGTRQALTNAQREPLRRGAGFAQPGGSPQVRDLQADLKRRGVDPGPVDGLYGPNTEAAVAQLQQRNGIPDSGVVTASTRRVLGGGGERADNQPADEPANQPADEPSGGAPAPEAPNQTQEPVTPVAATTGDSDDVALPIAILIGALALVAGLLGGALLGRRNRVVSGTAVPLADGVVAQGTSTSKGIGHFRGNVHALVLGRRGIRRTPEARYLVSDPGIKDPFWVSQDEVSNIMPPSRGRPRERTPANIVAVRALGYISIPERSGLQSEEFSDQLSAIDAYCDEQGWDLVEVVQDVDSVAQAKERQGLLYALEKIGRGEATCIIVAELGRLSRSAADLGGILERLERSDGRLVALDIGLDTATREGHVAAQALTSVGAWEHDRPSRTLAAATATAPSSPVAPVVQDVPALKERIVHMRAQGMTLQAIADVLNAEGVPTLRGGAKWRPSSVQSAAGYRRPPKRQEE